MPKDCNHQVRRYEAAVFVHEHHPVGVTVVNYSDICSRFPYKILEGLDILLHKRIRLMVREAAVKLSKNIVRDISEDIVGIQRSHAV